MHRLSVDHHRRRVLQDLLVRHDRGGQPALDGLDADAREGLPIDPDGSAVQRRIAPDRLEPHDVAVVSADAVGAVQAISVSLVEPQLQRQRQHLLRLEQRERRAIGPPARSVDEEGQLFPLHLRSGNEVPVLADDVVAGIGGRGTEVLLHPGACDVVPHEPVVQALARLVPGDDLGDRQSAVGRDAAAVAEHVDRTAIEINQHRSAGQRRTQARGAGRGITGECLDRTLGAGHEVLHDRRAFDGEPNRDVERLRAPVSPVREKGAECLVVEEQPVRDRAGVGPTHRQLKRRARIVEARDVVRQQDGD